MKTLSETTIREQLFAIRARHPSQRNAFVEDCLRAAADQYGLDRAGKWSVVHTAFHGGGVLSTHRTAIYAAQAIWARRQRTDCVCGCIGMVPAAEIGALPTADQCRSPYALAR